MRLVIIAASLACLVPACAAMARIPQDAKEGAAAEKAFRWTEGQTLVLPLSNATLTAPPPVKQLAGIDAVRAWATVSGVPVPAGIEAVVYDPRSRELVLFQKVGRGYVPLDDWNTLDVDAILRTVTEITESGNGKRRQAGLPSLRVVGWLEPPHLDRSTNSVSWAVEAIGDNGLRIINSMALVFGRDGFEMLVWGGNSTFTSSRDLLKIAQSSFSFFPGSRYSDYQPGDRLSEYGVASSTAAVLGMRRGSH